MFLSRQCSREFVDRTPERDAGMSDIHVPSGGCVGADSGLSSRPAEAVGIERGQRRNGEMWVSGWAINRTPETTDMVRSKQAGLFQSRPRRNEDGSCEHIPTMTLLARSLDNKRPYSRHLVCVPYYRIGIKGRWFRLRGAVLSFLMNLDIPT